MKTDIIATIGKASQRSSTILKMIEEGMTIARLNFSHETTQIHKKRLKLLREVKRKHRKKIKIMLDLKGPEVRLWGLHKPIVVKKGNMITLTEKTQAKRSSLGPHIQITNPAFLSSVSKGTRILIDDGKAEFVVVKTANNAVTCKAIDDCVLKPRKSVCAEYLSLDQGAITRDDHEALRFAAKEKVDYVALSHVQTEEDVLHAKEILGQSRIKVIAKIENITALRHLDSILEHSDGVMIARGDLGTNLPLTLLPSIQEHILSRCKKTKKICLVATQLIETLINHQRPSRSEVLDVYNAVRQGATGLVLAGETAIGKHPDLAIKWTQDIARTAEEQNKRKAERLVIRNALK